jgi:hypothetical protein
MTPSQLGAYLAFLPAGIVCWHALFFPKLIERYQLGGTLRRFSFTYPLLWLVCLLISFCNQTSVLIKGSLLVALFILTVLADTLAGAMDVVTPNRCAGEHQLALSCATNELVAQVAIALASPFCGALFAWSVSTNRLGGGAIWVIMFFLSLSVPLVSFRFENLPSWMDARDTGEYQPMMQGEN